MATAFCIYSETDNSLNFYKRESVPVVGDTFNDRVVTKVYTNISASTPGSSKYFKVTIDDSGEFSISPDA